MSGPMAREGRDKQHREKYEDFSSVKYARAKRLKFSHPNAEPKMQ